MHSVDLIATARHAQVDRYGPGMFAKVEDENLDGELISAAICYAKQAAGVDRHCRQRGLVGQPSLPAGWPAGWPADEWCPLPQVKGDPSPMIRPEDAIAMLATAGAYIAAEIERLERTLVELPTP